MFYETITDWSREAGNIFISFCKILRKRYNSPEIVGIIAIPNVFDFSEEVLHISGGIGELGTLQWPLCLFLLFSTALTFGALCKGVRSVGKVCYVFFLKHLVKTSNSIFNNLIPLLSLNIMSYNFSRAK